MTISAQKGKIEKKKVQNGTPVLKDKGEQRSTELSFQIVGIGASAGGLEALEQFFSNMPEDSGMAFVIIQHLDPDHKGILPELLQRTTAMRVIQVSDHLLIKPNHVYVIPPNKSLAILNGFLHLFIPTQERGFRLPIDIFFRSLADDQKEKSIGIVLSGMGSDGSLGLKAIKEKNGLVLVQAPQTSKFNGMPNSAISAVSVDIIASPQELPEKLIAFLRLSPAISRNLELDDKNKSNLEKIIILIRIHTGYDFSMYKRTTLYRRIERRMNIHQLGKITDYVIFLQENPNELEILFKELLIGVTNFFRDAKVWDNLKKQILPDLYNNLPEGYVLRVWSVGCSTGEEAYSFAIVFNEVCEKAMQNKNITLQLFATDINSDAIGIARKGIYNSTILADVSPERLTRFFTKSESTYTINSSIREMVIFAQHSVIKEPPFTKLDILLCRNLLIYMESELQKKLMNLFYYSLDPGGILILGNAETENSKDMAFTSIDTKLKIFRRSSAPKEIEMMDFPATFSISTKRKPTEIIASKVTNNIQTLADQLLLHRLAPASVLINQEGDILYITGRVGKYLEPAAGKADMNVYSMAREGLRNELLSGIRKAKQNYEPIILRNIKVGTNGGTQFVDISIQTTKEPNEIRGTIMIVFSDTIMGQKPVIRNLKNEKHIVTNREQELEAELKITMEELQSSREEMQTSQEELKSTNEELQSTNEELQSTNEELTTSKEEMQSMNEELQTINAELQSKIADFVEANSDMKNLLNSTDIATLFLDKELKIRRFTDQLTELIKLRPIDLGRPFTEMVSDLQFPEIADKCKEVLKSLIPIEIDRSTSDKRWFKVRITPYRTLDDRIDGLVITFINITVAKKLEVELNDSIEILRKHNLPES